MKKGTNNRRKIVVNLNIFSNNKFDGKDFIAIIFLLVLITLVVSICDSDSRAEIIRLLFSMIINC